MSTTLTAADVLAALTSATDAQHAAIRAALKARTTPEQAAASAAYVGKGFPCTAAPVCGRFLRTAKRASIHGVDGGGHTAA